jgi:FkbM family methyltransferase
MKKKELMKFIDKFRFPKIGKIYWIIRRNRVYSAPSLRQAKILVRHISRGWDYGTPFVEEYIKKVASDCPVIMDVGGNIGYTSNAYICILNKLGKGRVIGLEPVLENCAHIIRNVKDKSRYSLLSIGLGAERETIRLDIPDYAFKGNHDTENSGLLSKYGHGTPTKQSRYGEIFTLDELNLLSKSSQLSFLKVDIEGMELEFFQGAINTLRLYKPMVQFEFNPNTSNLSELITIAKLLQSIGYVLYSQDPKYKYGDRAEFYCIHNYYKSRLETISELFKVALK